MLAIGNKLISDDVISVRFVCNLEACLGACCWEGDYGAPLEDEEIGILERILPAISTYLTKEGLEIINEKGAAVHYKKENDMGTPLLPSGACAYMSRDENGVAQCGIERAFLDGKTDFRKPVSCHLYPVRITEYDGFVAVNYDQWDICSPACEKGKSLQVPVFRFVKDALIRKFGQEFYDELEAAAVFQSKTKSGSFGPEEFF